MARALCAVRALVVTGVMGNPFATGASRDPNKRSIPGAVARTYRLTDPTTASDRLRIRNARAVVRAAIKQVAASDVGAVQNIFRQEIGTNVRSASPLALSLAASLGATLTNLVDRMEPCPGWPRAPALSQRPAIEFLRAREPERRVVVSTSEGDKEVFRLRGFGHGLVIMQSRGDFACIEVIDHSIEVDARIGPVKIETLFGTLRIELDHAIPATLAAACIGRSVCEVVDHPALRGRHWPIASIEEPPSSTLGQTLVVETGSVAFQMPWMR